MKDALNRMRKDMRTVPQGFCEDCGPRKRFKSHLEPHTKVPCLGRTCPYVGYREAWAKREKQCSNQASRRIDLRRGTQSMHISSML